MRRDLNALEQQSFDVVIVGGGMHGAWIAYRAALAGLAVALIEKNDFAGATSANSLKILHGGLRYLQHLDFSRMRSSITARREFARQAPQLFEPLGSLMPLQAFGMRSPPVLGAALLITDLISARRNAGVAPSAALPRGRLVSAADCKNALSPLVGRSPIAGAIWWDGLAKDTARLALEPLLAAARAGAVVANRVCAERYLHQSGRIHGVEATDTLTGRRFEIRSRVVVNAAGPWIAELSRQAGLTTQFMPPAWIGGLNLVLRRSLGLASAVALSSASVHKGRRELFFVPWRSVTLIGTHYQPMDSVNAVHTAAPQLAIATLVAEAAQLAPRAKLSADDIALVHWGALPLAAQGDSLPAKAPILVGGHNATGAHGLIAVVAEKLTSAPHLSKSVLACVLRELGSAPAANKIRPAATSPPVRDMPLSPGVVARLISRYGADWQRVARHAESDVALLQPITKNCDVLGVEVVHGIRDEMALTLQDLVMRRLGLGDTGDPGHDVLESCVKIAAGEWSLNAMDQTRAVTELVAWFWDNRHGQPDQAALAST